MKKELKKIIYMGTPYFAKEVLKSIIDAGYQINAVITQPDKPVGRKRIFEKTPVRIMAEEHQIPVYQPLNIRTDHDYIFEINPDLIITCAYGQMIPKSIIDRFLCVNIHASLLPKLRGGAPIHRAIMNGEKETGITLMKMALKMDAGDTFHQKRISIDQYDTLGTLKDKLIALAQEMIVDQLPMILNNEIVFVPQNETDATFGYNISKEEEFVSFERPYQTVYDHIRALIPSPISYGIVDNVKIRFHNVLASDMQTDEENGSIVGLYQDHLAIALDKRLLLINKLQVEGRKIINAKDFYNGMGKNLIGKKFM
ncbi:MAG: methionyl-tRNA formyltransferase [Erysipelotrichaceae bacterium]|nr:methionyl-tRNA formyltransferase [Erysipelotrichaceae bacterium]MDD4642913.1 methionyl-tRNA formyltransferase [Erysipelotrichaceae bacterium]